MNLYVNGKPRAFTRLTGIGNVWTYRAPDSVRYEAVKAGTGKWFARVAIVRGGQVQLEVTAAIKKTPQGAISAAERKAHDLACKMAESTSLQGVVPKVAV